MHIDSGDDGHEFAGLVDSTASHIAAYLAELGRLPGSTLQWIDLTTGAQTETWLRLAGTLAVIASLAHERVAYRHYYGASLREDGPAPVLYRLAGLIFLMVISPEDVNPDFDQSPVDLLRRAHRELRRLRDITITAHQ